MFPRLMGTIVFFLIFFTIILLLYYIFYVCGCLWTIEKNI